MIKKQLILPYVDLDIQRYDLSIENRDATDDKGGIFLFFPDLIFSRSLLKFSQEKPQNDSSFKILNLWKM